MAYQTGTGADQQDLLDAVRAFALGLGWTIVEWDAGNERLKLEKGLCHVSWTWGNTNQTAYDGYQGSSYVISDGWIRGGLSSSLVAGADLYAQPGSAGTSSQNYNMVTIGDLTGPYIGWHLFSNASGDYIHVAVQTTADRWCHFGFGNADNGGLTHSGAAYLFGDGSPYYFRHSSSYAASSDSLYYNDAGLVGPMWATGGERYTNNAYFHTYQEDAGPVGYANGICVPSYAYSTYERTSARAIPLMTPSTFLSTPSEYPTIYLFGGRLLDHLMVMEVPGHAPYVPMMGIPLMQTNTARTSAIALGSVADLRMINLTGLSAAQEVSLGTDVWVVFPTKRLTPWSDVKSAEACCSGYYGIAYKKIP